MIIYVTSDDIKKGIRGWSGSCPVALALRRAFKLDWEHELTASEVEFSIWRGRGEEVYELPAAMTDWIKTYDAGGEVQPTDFELIGL